MNKKINDKMNNNQPRTDIRHPRNLKDVTCEEGARSDFICNAIDKDYRIEYTLVRLSIILNNLEKDVERVKECCTDLCKLTDLKLQRPTVPETSLAS